MKKSDIKEYPFFVYAKNNIQLFRTWKQIAADKFKHPDITIPDIINTLSKNSILMIIEDDLDPLTMVSFSAICISDAGVICSVFLSEVEPLGA